MYLMVVPVDYQTYITLDTNILKLQNSQNPATSSKQLIPLEPDFSQMSHPSVTIDPPNSTDYSQTRPSRKEQSRRNHRSKKRRRHRSSSSSSTSRSASLSSSRRRKKSKRLKHSHKKRRRRSMTPSSSSNTSQSEIDFGRYKRARKSPQVAQTPVPIQPEKPNFNPVNTQPIYIIGEVHPNLSQPNKESDSETETEIWSFDRAINEVFRLLPAELCPKTQQEQAPSKPLSGIEHLMEFRMNLLLILPQSKLVENTTKYIQNRLDSDNAELCPKTQQEQAPSKPLSGIEHLMEFRMNLLLILPQSKLVENTTKYIQNRLDSDKCFKDWKCSQNLVSVLAPTRFYKSQNQYLPTDNISQLEADASPRSVKQRKSFHSFEEFGSMGKEG